jgi:integrase
MAFNRLTLGELSTLGPGFHADGGNLYLLVEPNKAGDAYNRRWMFRYQMRGITRDMGLGSLDSLGADRAGLELVRRLAAANRKLLAQGIDPIEQRKAEAAKSAAQKPTPTFAELARDYIIAHRPEWKNAKHGKQWESTLRDYVLPSIGKIPVDQIEIVHVHKVLAPIWNEKTETAKRVRNRIELILESASALGFRSGDNPAGWRKLSTLLAKPSKIANPEPHAALPYAEMPALMAALRNRKGSVAALALEFCILTCARSDEVLATEWSEIDFAESSWSIPEGRMKNAKPHDVPLAKRALEILQQVRAMTTAIGSKVAASKYIFPNSVSGERLSSSALLALLKIRMKQRDVTVHGMRAAFRTWCNEETNFPAELCEMALSHAVGDKTERAYQRGTGFQKRIKLAEAWANYCARPPVSEGRVVAFKPLAQSST